MPHSRPRVAFPVLVIGGSLCLVFLGFLVGYLSPAKQTPHWSESMRLPSSPPPAPLPVPPVTPVSDIAVAVSGDLQQSVPPNWTFMQMTEAPGDVPFRMDGLQASRDIRLRSLQGGTVARLIEYAVTDRPALERDIATKVPKEQDIGKRKVRTIATSDGKGIRGLFLDGNTEVVVLWAEEDKPWDSVDGMLGELKDLVQSLRVQ